MGGMFRSFAAKRDVIIVIALCLTIIVIYWQVRDFKFVFYDDNAYVTERAHVMSGLTSQGVKWAMTSTEVGFWHPLTWLSLMIDRELFGNNAGGYHWTSVTLHIINTLILFVFLKEATLAPLRSAFVALLFAIHPLHVESVAWVSQRKDLLCTLFGFISLLGYVRYSRAPDWRRYFLVVIFFILGLMSKPMIVTFPFVMLLMDFWPLRRMQPLRIKRIESPPQADYPCNQRSFFMLLAEKFPLLLLSIIASILVIFTEDKAGALTKLESLTIIERFANAIVAYVKYIVLTFWPTHLAFLYPHPVTIPTGQAVGALILMGLITLISILSYRWKPYLFVGWFWYVGTLLPVIGIVQVGPHAMADRYTYLTIIGLFIIVVWGIIDLTEGWKYKKTFLWMAGLSTVIGLSLCAWVQVGYWRNSTVLFEHAIKVTKGNFIAMNNLGNVYIENGHIDKGLAQIGEAINIRPNYGPLYHNVGVGLFIKGDYERAIEYLTTAQRKAFRNDENLRFLGDAYMRTGKDKLSMDAYRKALVINDKNIPARHGLAILLNKLGQNDEAMQELSKILSYDPNNTDVRKKFLMILWETGDFKAMIRESEKALAIDSTDSEIQHMMSRAYKKVKQN